MADRRMFSKQIIDSDAFIDMPISARLLYYDLGMRADDDGFVNSPKKIMRMIGASLDDMNVLVSRRFVIPIDTGLVVIKHWNINNKIRKDTYRPTTYSDEKKLLGVDENGAYFLLCNESVQIRNESVTNPYENRTEMYPNKVNKDNKDNLISIGEVEDTGQTAAAASGPIKELYPDNLNEILVLWNQQVVTKHIKEIPPLGRRYEHTRLCLQHVDSFEGFLDVIRSLDQQAWFRKQAEIGKKLSYDWFCDPNNFLKIVEGNYETAYGKDNGVPESWEVIP